MIYLADGTMHAKAFMNIIKASTFFDQEIAQLTN